MEEITNGSFDDTIRHMISKMSDYHFVTSDNYKKRLSKMGENPKIYLILVLLEH